MDTGQTKQSALPCSLSFPLMTTSTTSTLYSGWKNYQTWNVALWLNNDEGYYAVAQDSEEIGDWIDYLHTNGITHTPDGVAIDGPDLDYEALDDLVKSINA